MTNATWNKNIWVKMVKNHLMLGEQTLSFNSHFIATKFAKCIYMQN